MVSPLGEVAMEVYPVSWRRSPGAYFGAVMEYWKPGDQVVVRDIRGGRIRAAVAMTVVEDNARWAVLYLGRGYPFCLPGDLTGRLTKDVLGFERLIPLRWEGFEQLSIAGASESHAVILRWTWPDWQFAEWYVNLQAPLVRTPTGFDSTDYALDVVISAGRDRWHWKDEQQLAELVLSGHFSPEDAEAFRAEGERAIDRARNGESPFDEGWESWRPDPSWPIPDLPEGWELVPESRP